MPYANGDQLLPADPFCSLYLRSLSLPLQCAERVPPSDLHGYSIISISACRGMIVIVPCPYDVAEFSGPPSAVNVISTGTG